MKLKIYPEELYSLFPIYAHTADIDFSQPKVTRPSGYEHHQIFLIEKGQVFLKLDNNSYELSENDMFYVCSNVAHEYYGIGGNFITSFLSFSGDGFESLRNYYKLKPYGVYSEKNKNKIKNSLIKVFGVLDKSVDTPVICSHAFSAITTFFDETCKEEYSPIEKVCYYLETNFENPISLDDLLAFYPYSKAKLCRDFKEKYSMTIFEMLIRIRLKHAQFILNSNPYLNLKSVAKLCGFSDVSYFCKLYRRFWGESPKNKKFP